MHVLLIRRAIQMMELWIRELDGCPCSLKKTCDEIAAGYFFVTRKEKGSIKAEE
jgi:hypothetical protein